MSSSKQQPTDSAQDIRLVADHASVAQNTLQPFHDLIHGAKIARNCESRWDSMQAQTENDCLRQCQRCNLWVVKATDPSSNNFQQLLQNNANLFKNKQLFRCQDGTFTLGDCYAKRYSSYWNVAAASSVPLYLLLTYIMAPGYIIPFLNHPIGKIVFLGLLAWHILGSLLFARTNNFLLRLAIFIIFSMPLIIVPMIGPAHMGIMQALGPVIQSR